MNLSEQDPAPRTRFALALVVLPVALALVLFPAIFQGRYLSSADLLAGSLPWSQGSSLQGAEIHGQHSDPVYFFEPWLHFARTEVREHGELPLRNPLAALGVPFLANAQSAVLSLFTLPCYVLPERVAAWVSALSKLTLAALGAALLARSLGRSRAASMVAGGAYGLSGFMVLWLTYPLASALALLPFALLGVRLLRTRPRTGSLLLASSLGLAILGGHPECAFQVGATTLAWFVCEWLGAPRTERLRLLARGLLSAIAGVLLAAPQVLPFCDSLLSSSILKARTDDAFRTLRLAHPPELPSGTAVLANLAALATAGALLVVAARIARQTAGRNRSARGGDLLLAVVAGALLAFFAARAFQAGAWNVFPLLIDPHYYGVSDAAPGGDRYCGPVNFIELNGAYVGAGLLLVVLLAPALSRDRNRSFWFLYVGYFLCVLIACDAPPFSQALAAVPPFQLTVNRRLLGMAALFAALLAAWSLDGLPRLTADRRRFAGVLALGLSTAVGIALLAIDSRTWPDRGGAEAPETLPVPLGAPTAHLTAPLVKSTLRGDEVAVRGFALALDPLPDVRVRLTSRAGGMSRETPVDAGLDTPRPGNTTLQLYPRSDSSGFETRLSLAGFSAGDATLEVLSRSAGGEEQVLARSLVRIARPLGLRRACWTLPLAALALLLAVVGRPWVRRLGLALFLSVSFADLLVFARQHIPMIESGHHYPPFLGLEQIRDPQGGRFLAAEAVLPPNTHMAYGLVSAVGQDLVDSQGLRTFLNQVRTPRPNTPLSTALGFNLENELFPALGVSRLVVPAAVAVSSSEGRVLFEGGGVKVLEPAVPPVRARFYPSWVRRSSEQTALAVLREHQVSAADLLVLPPATPPAPDPPVAPAGAAGSTGARLVHDRPAEIRVDVDPGPAGYLLVTDLYSRHFDAAVNGSPVPVEAAFDALLAVALPASADLRTVTLRYRPLPFRIGCWLAAAGALLLVLTTTYRPRLLRR